MTLMEKRKNTANRPQVKMQISLSLENSYAKIAAALHPKEHKWNAGLCLQHLFGGGEGFLPKQENTGRYTRETVPEALGLFAFEEAVFERQIDHIIADIQESDFVYRDGYTAEYTWEERSRSESGRMT
jgi:hypothetical protein